jgi:hypothetical protein
VLLALCWASSQPEWSDRRQNLLRQPLSWQRVLDLAERHGVQPQIYRSLSAEEAFVPADISQRIHQNYQGNLHKTLLLSRELIHILERLAAAGIEVIPYKGLALAEYLYGDVAERQAGDIDLLIRPQDVLRARDVLSQLGYTQHSLLRRPAERAYLKSGYEYSFDGRAAPNLLELQWAILPRFYAIDFDTLAFFQRAEPAAVAGYPTKALNCSDLLLILSAHAAKHVWGRLVWLNDIAQLVTRRTLDWDWIWAEAQRLGMRRILGVTLLLAHQLLGAALPSSAQPHLDPAASDIAREIEAEMATQTSFNVESPAYFRLMLRLRERTSDRVRFLSRLGLTPGPGEWNAVHLPDGLFPAYRLVRLCRLAAKLVRV